MMDSVNPQAVTCGILSGCIVTNTVIKLVFCQSDVITISAYLVFLEAYFKIFNGEHETESLICVRVG